ncbi:MAG: bifunctional folylpolyglutamate synthase/dihydrofolate synthase, partial [Acidobacteriaceae bacterium]|nr:bifunctional folylpolyglutamate synthase/dihydrofolate synthase [Acidobacteriaceae bacterium]
YSLGNEIKAGAKFGLEGIGTLLKELDNPESGQHFVHVAGTNGKGSTCAMIAKVCEGSGLRTGLYTSPHLIEPTERIQINGSPVSAKIFADTFETVHNAAERLLATGRLDAHPSYFETVTAMALLIFREYCDISIIEVGMGGRLDATNVITPDLCVITGIAFDHESYLGNTLEAIAGEKAGIIKPTVPVVMSKQPAAAEAVFRQRATDLNCELISTKGARISDMAATAYDSTFTLEGESYTCGLAGRHQIENASAAILACKRLGLRADSIHAGVKDVRWPGRLEFVANSPDFVLDGAHNPAGAAALASYIREFWLGRPVWLVYGAMRDKAIEEVADQLFPLAEQLIVTAPDFPRAVRSHAILEIHNHPNSAIAPTVADAIELARAAPCDAVVFFTGSLFLVGEARALLARTPVAA